VIVSLYSTQNAGADHTEFMDVHGWYKVNFSGLTPSNPNLHLCCGAAKIIFSWVGECDEDHNMHIVMESVSLDLSSLSQVNRTLPCKN